MDNLNVRTPAPRIQVVIDPKTGLVERSWYLFFARLTDQTVSIFDEVTDLDARMDAAEAAIIVLDGRVDVLEDEIGSMSRTFMMMGA